MFDEDSPLYLIANNVKKEEMSHKTLLLDILVDMKHCYDLYWPNATWSLFPESAEHPGQGDDERRLHLQSPRQSEHTSEQPHGGGDRIVTETV